LKQIINNKKASACLSRARLIYSLSMKSIQEALKESPVSPYTGSEKTFELVANQIKARWGESELKNYDPFHNARTFRSWLSLGFRVRKNEKALRSIVYTETKDTKGNVIKKARRHIYLFYYRQVEKINAK